MLLPAMALLPQRDEVPDDVFCNNETMSGENCIDKQCECHHGIKVSNFYCIIWNYENII